MDNLTLLQKNCLDLGATAKQNGSTVNVVGYIIGTTPTESLDFIAGPAEKLIYFDPQRNLSATNQPIENPKIELLTSLEPRDCFVLSINGHINNRQFGTELSILKAFNKVFANNNPLTCVRSEDPDQSTLILEFFELINYDTWYLHKQISETEHQVWIFGVNKAVSVTPFGWDLAKVTGHPNQAYYQPSSVEYQFVQ